MPTVVIVCTMTLVVWVVGGMALIILNSGSSALDPILPAFGFILPATGVGLGLFISAKLFGGKPRK
jgi:hypothetical protein